MIDSGRFERLQRESRRTGSSIGEIVRRAIDRALPSDLDARAEAGRRLLELADPPGSGPEPDWEIQKEQMLDELYGGPDDLK